MEYTVYSMQYTVCSIQYTVCSMQYTVCSIQYGVYSIQYTVCSIQYAVYSIQYAVYILSLFQLTVTSIKYIHRLTQQIIAQKLVLLYFIIKETCFGYCHLQANL
jgi:hypothetical protein